MAIKRAVVIQRMRKAIGKGQTVTSFIEEMRKKGLAYTRSDMYTDYRELMSIMHVEGRASKTRKGYIPIEHIAELKAWDMSREFMYKIKTERLTSEGKRLEPKFINIMSNKALTVEQVEREAFRRAFEQSPPDTGEERSFTIDTVIRRIKD